MANRYCNLIPTKKISEDFQNITLGFDRVQQEMDAGDTELSDHVQDDHRHWTETDRQKMNGIEAGAQVNTVNRVAGRQGEVEIGWEDVQDRPSSNPSTIDDAVVKRHEHSNKSILDATEEAYTTAEQAKLAGIESGAEVNQNAFSKINDAQANTTTDELNITGGTGITITTNPAEKSVIVTATGESTPGIHGSSHLEHGTDPIPYATEIDGGLMAAQDKVKLVNMPQIILSATEPTQYNEHTVWLMDLGN